MTRANAFRVRGWKKRRDRDGKLEKIEKEQALEGGSEEMMENKSIRCIMKGATRKEGGEGRNRLKSEVTVRGSDSNMKEEVG